MKRNKAHPIEQLCKEYDITRYKLAMTSGLRESALSNLVVKNSPIENIKLKTILKMADALEIPYGTLIDKLLEYEKALVIYQE